MATLADIYLRLSDFRKDEADSFPDREKQLRELAGRLGWAVRRVAIENDVDEVGQRKPASAFKRREIKHPDGTVEKIVWRPEFRNLIADLYAGRIQAVLAEDLDRLARQPRDMEDFLDACEDTRASVRSLSGSLTITNGGTDSERFMARVMVAQAEKSSADAKRRMEDSRARRAADGKWGGNGHRPFGYRLLGGGKLAIIETEAAVLRQAAAEVLASIWDPALNRPSGGESLASLAAGLREAGITTPAGKPWTAKMLREALLKPSIAGLAVVHERHRDTGEHRISLQRAEWPAIIDRDTWDAVCAKLRDPARLTSKGNTPRHLGTGIYTCHCGAPVKVHSGGRRRQPAYVCNGEGRCVRRLASAVDAVAVAHVIARLERPDLTSLLRPVPAAGVDVAALRKRRTVLEARGKAAARMFALGEIPEAEYAEAARVRKAELDKIAAELATPTAADPLAEFRDGADAGEVWRGLSLARKRAVLRLLVQVRILPSAPAGPGKFHRETVEVTERA